jgi:hypothetical protein
MSKKLTKAEIEQLTAEEKKELESLPEEEIEELRISDGLSREEAYISWGEFLEAYGKYLSHEQIFWMMVKGKLLITGSPPPKKGMLSMDSALKKYGPSRLIEFFSDYNIEFEMASLHDFDESVLLDKDADASRSVEEDDSTADKPEAEKDANASRSVESAEAFARKITVRYDNKEQFKIKIPGHPFKPIPYSALTRTAKDVNFKYLLEAIEKGTFHTSHRPSGLAFERGCFKLTNYIRKNYYPSLPMKFKIYEKEGKTYRLIFQREEDTAFDPYGEFEKLSKEEVLEEYEAICRKLQNPPEFATDKDKHNWKKNLADEATEIWLAAIKKGVKAAELSKIAKKAGLDTEDLVEKENDNEFFDEGFQITSKP